MISLAWLYQQYENLKKAHEEYLQRHCWKHAAAANAQPEGVMFSTDSKDNDKSGLCILGHRTSFFAPKPRLSREEKWAERENELLDIALHLLEQEGFAEFSMEKLIRNCNFSKGTVYNHFSGKEDCQAALCLRGMHYVGELMTRAYAFDGHARERLLAFHFAYSLYSRVNPTMFLSVVTCRTPGFQEKVAPERALKIIEMDRYLFQLAGDALRKARDEGALPVDENLDEIALTFLNWSTSFGVCALTTTGFDTESSRAIRQRNLPLMAANLMMDGMGVMPSSKEWDYDKTWDRIAQEVFAPELTMLLHNQRPELAPQGEQ
jgi:AcrR family transcriptional regulator